MGSHGRRRRRDLLGAALPTSLTQEVPGPSRREYLSAAQLAEVTPWTVDAIEKMIRRGILKENRHYFRPFGHRTQRIFKWHAIVTLIEGDHTKSDDMQREHVVETRGQIDVEKAKAGLGRLLSR
jgi:hypothetical protein